MPTPLDTLNALKGQEVIVEKRDKEIVEGKLVSFDLNINIGIETSKGLEFIQGQSVNTISKKDGM